jgi:hypothetical protein
MADRKTYPSIPVRVWWDLRRRAQQSPPTKVDADYLQTVLGVQEGHAKNLIAPLTSFGLIDDAGKLTPLGEDWRHDESYAAACKLILEKVYPQALREALPPPKPDRAAVESWFARNAQVGTGAAGKMATIYLLVADADPAGATAQPAAEGGTPRKPAARKRTVNTPRLNSGNGASEDAAAAKAAAAAAATGSMGASGRGDLGPSVHVDVQVHISPDASADQIDAIFASMAKHLYAQRS